MEYTINHGQKRLSGFYPNDLPVGKTGNFTPRTIFSFRSADHTVFGSEAEAKGYISYIHKEITDNGPRYESCIPGSFVKLLAFAGKLKVTPKENLI